MGVSLNLGQSHHVEMVFVQGFIPCGRCHSQPRFGLGATAIAPTSAPNTGRQELGGFDLVVAISAEQGQRPFIGKAERQLGMSAQVSRLVVCTAIHKGKRMIDLVGVSKSIPTTAGIARCTKGGIERLGRIEGLLHVIHGGLAFLHVSKHSHLYGQQVAEHPLVHVHVAGQVAQLVVQDNAHVIHVTQRDAVT